MNSISGAGKILGETDLKVRQMLPSPYFPFGDLGVGQQRMGSYLIYCLQLFLWGYWMDNEVSSPFLPWYFCALNSCIKCASLSPISAFYSLIMHLFSFFKPESHWAPKSSLPREYLAVLSDSSKTRRKKHKLIHPCLFFHLVVSTHNKQP